jgi:hypothetical protein
MPRRLPLSLAVAMSLFVVACSAGGGGSRVPAGVPAAQTATARLSLTIPGRGILARGRVPAYISPSTAQAVVTVNSGSPQTFSLSPTGPNCVASGSATACILAVAAPIGPSDTFQIVLEDASSNVLSGGTFTAAIAEGASNVTIPIVLGGVPKTLDITSAASLGAFFTIGGGAQTATLTTTFKDADGDILIGNEPFVNAAGAAAPVAITSTDGPPVSYATAPSGGSFGAASSSFSLSAPSDQLEMVFSGTGVPPGYDTLTYAGGSGVTSATFGNNTPYIGIGVVWHAPFVPLTIAPITADVAGAATVPHSAVVTDGVSHLAVVGGSSCAPSLSAGVAAIPSIATDGYAATADGTLYSIVDVISPTGTELVNYSLSAINAGTCTQTNLTSYSGTYAVGGIVRATLGNVVYFATDSSEGPNPTLEYATSTAPSTLVGGSTGAYAVGGLTLRAGGTHIFTCGNNFGSNILFTEYEIVLNPHLSAGSAPIYSGPQSADLGSGQTGSCAGVAIDGANGHAVYADQGSNVATVSYTNPISTLGALSLTGSTVVGSQTTDFQSAAAGSWRTNGEAFFVNASDGIEVFSQPAIAQLTVLQLANTGLSSAITSGSVEAIAYGDDARLWMTLSSGYVVALPAYH